MQNGVDRLLKPKTKYTHESENLKWNSSLKRYSKQIKNPLQNINVNKVANWEKQLKVERNDVVIFSFLYFDQLVLNIFNLLSSQGETQKWLQKNKKYQIRTQRFVFL